jgi:ferredoxin-NADP reductase
LAGAQRGPARRRAAQRRGRLSTQRSYSIASAPQDAKLALKVASPYLTGELGVGDELHLRGPIGGYFTWRTRDGGSLLLIA